MMLSHNQIWGAIDRLADRHGLSVSGLAKKAGLDPTTFNRSKRVTPDGRERWPSTESIAKVIAATDETVDSFMALLDGQERRIPRRSVPLIGLAQAGAGGFFDDAGFPVGGGWDEVEFPAVVDPNTYALEVSGDSMLPAFRAGDILVVSPEAQIRRGDRVVVRTREGEVMVKELKRRTAKTVELHSLNPAFEDRVLTTDEVQWLARILWVSQ